MEQVPINSPEIIKADLRLFQQHQQEILEIERDLIENSSSAYLIDEENELDFMLDAFRKGGYSYLLMEDNRAVGFMVMGPLNDGTELPQAVTENYPVENCLHIKVMYIKSTGEGIGSAMMDKLLEELDKEKWKYLFVRTWVDPPNEGAINFYTKHAGFEVVPDAIVESTKTKKDGSETFQIKRQYLSKKV
ncbi:MAG: GNAT family N-acetyltransferase [Patescibacteria group bacterium]|nr:GNAT family N-acetyltransferase [Patescibacteria group bacterium]